MSCNARKKCSNYSISDYWYALNLLLKKEAKLREIYSVKKTLFVFEQKFDKIQADLKWLREKHENLCMENEQMQTVNELLRSRKNNIFYTSDTSFDDAVSVRLTEFNQEQEIERTRNKQKRLHMILRETWSPQIRDLVLSGRIRPKILFLVTSYTNMPRDSSTAGYSVLSLYPRKSNGKF